MYQIGYLDGKIKMESFICSPHAVIRVNSQNSAKYNHLWI